MAPLMHGGIFLIIFLIKKYCLPADLDPPARVVQQRGDVDVRHRQGGWVVRREAGEEAVLDGDL